MTQSMTPVSIEALFAHPPVRTTVIKLADGTACTIHELPVSVIDKVRTISTTSHDNVNMTNVCYVATYALTGRKPTDAELKTVADEFGTRSVMKIYTEALKFSQLNEDAIEQEKKH